MILNTIQKAFIKKQNFIGVGKIDKYTFWQSVSIDLSFLPAQYYIKAFNTKIPGVTTASPGSRTEKPRFGTVAYAYQWNFWELIIDMLFEKFKT